MNDGLMMAIWAKSIDFGMPEAQWDGSDGLTITKMINCRLPIRVNIFFDGRFPMNYIM